MQLPNQPIQNEPAYKQGPNLIESPTQSYSPSMLKLIESVIKTSKGLLFIVEAALVLLFLYNYKLGADLVRLDNEIRAKEVEITEISPLEDTIYKDYGKYLAYKDLVATNIKTSEKIGLVYAYTPFEITINTLELQENILKLTLKTRNATDFAKLITSYLGSGKVERLVLKGANFNPQQDSFDFNIEVTVRKTL